MKKNNFDESKNFELLKEFFILCSTKKIGFLITQNKDDLDISFEDNSLSNILINIPDPDDKNLPFLLKKWIKKFKTDF